MRRAGVSTGSVHSDDPNIGAIWRRLRELSDQINASPFVGGRLITEESEGSNVVRGSGLKFVAGMARRIPHGLGRKARGFVEVYGVEVPSAGSVRLRAAATDEQFVTVVPSSTGTCFLWVY